MARIKTTAYPVNVFSKYTIKQLHELIKSYNIPNYARLKKLQLVELLNSRFNLNGNTLVLKSQLPNSFQTNNDYFDVFSDFTESQNPLLQSMDLPVALKRPAPATKGRKLIQENRKRVPTGTRGRPKKVTI